MRKRARRSAGSPFGARPSPWRRAARAVSAVALLGSVAGCTDAAGYDIDILLGKIPFLSTMRTSVAVDPYEMPRLPADGSIPVGHPRGEVPPPFTQADLAAGAPEIEGLQNPLQPTADVLARGQQLYQQHCYVCHGPQGAGDGPVVGGGRFPFAVPVTAAAVAGRSDGYLYAVIRVGRGLMPAYGDRTNHLDRWAMVLYMRQLGQQPGVAVPPGAPITPAAPAAQDTAPTTPDTAPGAQPGSR